MGNQIGSYKSGLSNNRQGTSSKKGFIHKVYAGALTDGAPSEAELTALIGSSPATKGAGWTAVVSDTAGTSLKYLVSSDGTSWLYSVYEVAT